MTKRVGQWAAAWSRRSGLIIITAYRPEDGKRKSCVSNAYRLSIRSTPRKFGEYDEDIVMHYVTTGVRLDDMSTEQKSSGVSRNPDDTDGSSQASQTGDASSLPQTWVMLPCSLLSKLHNCCCEEAVGCDAVWYAQIKKKEVVKFTQVRPVGKTRTGKATTKEGKGKEKMIEDEVTQDKDIEVCSEEEQEEEEEEDDLSTVSSSLSAKNYRKKKRIGDFVGTWGYKPQPWIDYCNGFKACDEFNKLYGSLGWKYRRRGTGKKDKESEKSLEEDPVGWQLVIDTVYFETSLYNSMAMHNAIRFHFHAQKKLETFEEYCISLCDEVLVMLESHHSPRKRRRK